MNSLLSTARPVTPWMQRLLWIACGLVLIVGLQLFVLSDFTERYFAWTIQPPLTAAFMGAAYWSAAVLEFMAARQRLWAHARAAVPAVFIFTALTFAATILHIDRFHLGAANPSETVFLTYVWLTVYAVVPPVLLILLFLQLRVPGGDPPPQVASHPAARGLIAVQATIMVALGVMLFLAPQASLEMWPWRLTPLTARAIGAWLLGLGIAAAQVTLENEWLRARPVTASCIAFAVLQFVALVRYPAALAWDGPAAWLYVLFLVSLLAVGGYGFIISQQTIALDKRYAS